MIVQLVDIGQEADVLCSTLGGVLSFSCLEVSSRRARSMPPDPTFQHRNYP